MRTLVLLLCVLGASALAPRTSAAQPADPAAGSATDPGASVMEPPPADPAPAPAAAPATRTADELRQICAEAMNADPSFAEAIAMTVNEQTVRQHRDAANAIAKNERHVILAYAAMWVLAALFLVFLWRRQQHLNGEIAQLRRDLEVATRDADPASPAK